MKKTPLLLTLIVSAFTMANAVSVTEPAIRQVERTGQQQRLLPKFQGSVTDAQAVPELYPGENNDVGPQYLMMEKAPRRTWWEAAVDTQYFYTSNMFFTEKGNVDTGILITSVYAAFAPTFNLGNGPLTMRLGYRHQRYNYGLDTTSNQLNNFDFDASTLFFNNRWQFADNWVAGLGAEYNRLLSHEDNWNEFYTEFVAGWGLERQIPIGDRHLISLAYAGAWHLTHTDPEPDENSNDRIDSILSLTWSWEMVDHVVLQPYYRFQWAHYTQNSDRNDTYHTLGVALTWLITDWASVRAFTSWEARDSNDEFVQDYEKFDTGGGVTFALRF